jgi:hypothetical protein
LLLEKAFDAIAKEVFKEEEEYFEFDEDEGNFQTLEYVDFEGNSRSVNVSGEWFSMSSTPRKSHPTHVSQVSFNISVFMT